MKQVLVFTFLISLTAAAQEVSSSVTLVAIQNTPHESPYNSRTTQDGYLYSLATKKPSGLEYQIRVGGQVVALISKIKNGTTWISSVRYVHSDEKGTPALITDGSGNTIDAPRYEPFGERRNPFDLAQPVSATHVAQVGFTGQDQDDDMGLVNMKGRVYDPKLARFLSPDPILSSGQGMNPFSYVRNSPANLIDPSGYDPIPYGGGVGVEIPSSGFGSSNGLGFGQNFGGAAHLNTGGPTLAPAGADDQSANRPASVNEIATEYTIGVATGAATGVAVAYGIGFVAGFAAGLGSVRNFV
jgi:RHS repeat-associated protein